MKGVTFVKSWHILSFLSILFLASAVLRVSAVTASQEIPTSHMSESRSQTENVSDLLMYIEEKQLQLDRREQQLEIRRSVLNRSREELKKQIIVLENAERELRVAIIETEAAVEEDLSTLTAVYDNMKPKEAIGLFEEMDPSFAAGFLNRMNPDQAAAIMAGISPEKAYAISVLMASRNSELLQR